ncbi:MAG: threonine/serine exporter family protein, partial [Candidatus Eremiobacteraeota bacterium]|nr:threonine/serine exporter family protein [Candidatus Eremiobacteraeota bacterium]
MSRRIDLTPPEDRRDAIPDDPRAIFLTTMARELHRAGVATDILESTVGGIAHAIGLPVQIFALPTYITLAIGSNLHQHVVMLRVAPGTVDLRKIAILNLIFDDLVAGKIDFAKASILLSEIDKRWPRHRARYDVPALAMVALGVAVLLGGGVREMIVATVIGACVGAISALGRRVALVGRLFEVIAAFVSTLIVALGTHLLGPTNVLIAIVAGVVVLLPGYSLTLALYELANANLVAGTARLGKVLSTLLALACGALLGFAVVGPSLLNTG